MEGNDQVEDTVGEEEEDIIEGEVLDDDEIEEDDDSNVNSERKFFKAFGLHQKDTGSRGATAPAW